MNFLLVAFVLQIFCLYVMILLSDYVLSLVSSLQALRKLRLRKAARKSSGRRLG